MWKRIVLLLTIVIAGSLSALVPPVPKYKNLPETWEATSLEGNFYTMDNFKGRKPNLPNNILAIRVQFNDVAFRSEAVYPDNIAHDDIFFDRWMLHLSDFFWKRVIYSMRLITFFIRKCLQCRILYLLTVPTAQKI
jgi:hypothetical protein